MAKRGGSVVVHIGEADQERLRAFAKWPHISGDHVTVYYKPRNGLFESRLNPHLGEYRTVRILGLLEHGGAQVLACEPVLGLPANRAAHIMLSVSDGVRHAFANEVVALYMAGDLALQTFPVQEVAGRVQYAGFGKPLAHFPDGYDDILWRI